jgi:uncharacterized protein YdhG (YjbR/CyaY superfamily)
MAETSKRTTSTKSGFTAEERAAMKSRAAELKAEARKEDGLKALQKAIGEMPEAEGKIASRIHEIVMENAPELIPKTWYGQPAWAKGEKDIVVFFQGASKFGTRYSTLGFNEAARLDDGSMWPVAYAVTKLTAADEKRIAELVRKAVG